MYSNNKEKFWDIQRGYANNILNSLLQLRVNFMMYWKKERRPLQGCGLWGIRQMLEAFQVDNSDHQAIWQHLILLQSCAHAEPWTEAPTHFWLTASPYTLNKGHRISWKQICKFAHTGDCAPLSYIRELQDSITCTSVSAQRRDSRRNNLKTVDVLENPLNRLLFRSNDTLRGSHPIHHEVYVQKRVGTV